MSAAAPAGAIRVWWPFIERYADAAFTDLPSALDYARAAHFTAAFHAGTDTLGSWCPIAGYRPAE